jgi:hypothetical protein
MRFALAWAFTTASSSGVMSPFFSRSNSAWMASARLGALSVIEKTMKGF